MSKPYSETEINSEQQIVDDSRRLARMFASFTKLGEQIAPLVSIKRACNEADARLAALREEESSLQTTLVSLRETLQNAKDTIAKAVNEKEQEIAKATADKQKQLDDVSRELAVRSEELTSMLTKREEFLKSIGAK